MYVCDAHAASAAVPTHTHTHRPASLLFGRPPASVHTGPARPRRALPGSQAAPACDRAPPPTRPTAPQAARAPPSPLPPAARGCRLLASPPPFAAARSGPVRHRRSRPIDPSLGALSTPVLTSCTAGPAQRARGAPARGRWSAHTAAAAEPPGSSPVVNTVAPRTMEDRGSRQSASMRARPSRLYRCRRAHAAAQRRSRLWPQASDERG